MLNVLGIETSCDETAAAIVTETGEVRSDVVKSQIATFVPYGGVVPELAARDHMTSLRHVVEAALSSAKMAARDVSGIAVTSRPGLLGALLVGLQYAKGLAWSLELPLVGVDHLVGHMLSVYLRREGEADRPMPELPFVALLVSGGHTALYRVAGFGEDDVIELGATRDDAVGEAYDKVGKLLGFRYPGGPEVDRRAAAGDPRRFATALPRPFSRKDHLELSFSGLKSAVARHVERTPPADDREIDDLCAAFQAHVVRSLVDKTLAAAERSGLRDIVVGGGVAANRGLRLELTRRAEEAGRRVFFPPFASCTDNAAMIAYVGALRLARGERDGLDLAPSARTVLLRVTRKGGGKRD